MKIIQISTNMLGESIVITGLGDDNQIYQWDKGEWVQPKSLTKPDIRDKYRIKQ